MATLPRTFRGDTILAASFTSDISGSIHFASYRMMLPTGRRSLFKWHLFTKILDLLYLQPQFPTAVVASLGPSLLRTVTRFVLQRFQQPQCGFTTNLSMMASLIPKSPRLIQAITALYQSWAFQERISARKAIQFCGSELVWERHTSVWCECEDLQDIGSLESLKWARTTY